jgi:hypothetical protein
MKDHSETYRRGIYYQNYCNIGHLTKECKLLNKFCQICKENDHNTDQCPSKAMTRRCPSKEIVTVHVVQAKTLVVQQ